MKGFMDKDFLLETETARKLFHDYAESTPVLDYHCHINPREIAEDRQFDNITQVVQISVTLLWRIRLRTLMEGSCNLALHRFQTSSAVLLLSTPVYPKYLCNSRWLQ